MAAQIAGPDEPPLRIAGVGVPVLTYIVTALGALGACRYWHLHGLPLVATLVVPVAALVWMIVRMRARRTVCSTTPAQRTYHRRFFALMISYAVLVIGVSWVVKHYGPHGGPLAFLLALLPALPLAGVVWAMGRMVIDETDEYIRMLHIRQMMIATGFMLVGVCTWGFLEQFDQVPHIPLYWAFIIWCAGLGVGGLYNEVRK